MLGELPEPVRRHLEQEVLAPALVGWIRLVDGSIVDHRAADPDLEAQLEAQPSIEDALPVFVGMLPLEGRRLSLRAVTLGERAPLDLHAFEEGEETWVLLVDEGRRGEALRALMQQANARALESRPSEGTVDLFEDLTRGLDAAVFELRDGRDLVLRTPAPGWLEAELGALARGAQIGASALSDFVADFLAAHAQAADRSGFRRSLPWTEAVGDLGEITRECLLGSGRSGRPFLVVRRLGSEMADRTRPIQVGRQLGLHHEKLVRQMEEKDVLLHCIVHDLANPLSAVLNCLELLQGGLEAELEEVREVALGEARRQKELVDSLLGVFEAERVEAAPEPTSLDALIARLEPGARMSARLRQLDFRVRGEPPFPEVAAEPLRLERVVQNLVENAIRVSPPGSAVVLGVERAEDAIRLVVEDDGPGVPEELRDEIFMKLRSRASGRGKLGLGLYFCRITVERWGGRVRHRNLEPRGSRFEVELRPSAPPGS